MMRSATGQRRPYIIYALPFEETSGGNIALHLLCDRLNEMGETAWLWPVGQPFRLLPNNWSSLKDRLRQVRDWFRDKQFSTGPFPRRIATRNDLRSAIILYPEIVGGNPLAADHVVRWFLHRPGYHLDNVDYGDGELYFFYQDAFNDPTINPHPENRLTLTFFNPVYRQTHFGERTGTCYLLRKGKERARGIDFGDQLCVDDLSHEEKAAAFNRYRYLHSFDTYSMYSVFAAMCGCVPVIEPVSGVSREQWFPEPADRYGLAYGWEDERWAVDTRDALLHGLARIREEQDAMLARFIVRTQAFFAPAAPAR